MSTLLSDVGGPRSTAATLSRLTRMRRLLVRRRGHSIIYFAFVLIAAFGIVSLAVDLGRVRVSRVQLSTAADAAAIAGVQKLPIPDQPGGGVTGGLADAKAVGLLN